MKKTHNKWCTLAFDSTDIKTNKTSTTKTQKTQRTLTNLRNNINGTNNKTQINFFKQILPKTITDLAVHPKKVKEVEFWLENYVAKAQNKNITNFLLITGPTGSGKTSTLNVLCKCKSITISEWVNPVDHDFDAVFRGSNQLTRFTEFLTENRWNSLLEASGEKKIILVKDFPNVIIRNPEEFGSILEHCYYKATYPVVFICTDMSSKTINLSQILFPQDMQTKFNIGQISFNSYAPTLMKNALKRIQSILDETPNSFKKPNPTTIEAIIATSMGDIRCALNQYYFACLLGTNDIPLNKTIKHEKGTKRKRNEQLSINSLMARDENLGLFHGLGRVLNPKRTVNDNNTWRLNYNLDKLVDEFSIQPRTYVDFLFENYLKYFGDLNELCKATDSLSLSQVFLNNFTERSEILILALWISVMGLMVNNEHNVSRWNQIVAPKKIVKTVNNQMELKGLKTTDYFYYNIINKKECENVKF